MKIKNFVIAFGLPLMLSTTLFAQEAPVADKPEQDPAKRQEVLMQELKTELKLTPQQETKINELWKKQESEIKANREAQKQKMEALKNEREERRTQAEERQKANLAQMKAILTPEQYTRYLELRQERKMEHRGMGEMNRKGGGNHREGRPHNRPAGGPQ